MYELSIKSEFSAAHRLRGYKGKCEELHGHNLQVEVMIRKDDLDKIGMVVDFKKIKQKLNEVLLVLDHCYLNDLSYFKKVNPTSENISRYIYDRLNSKLRSSKLSVYKIIVWESSSCSASFYKE